MDKMKKRFLFGIMLLIGFCGLNRDAKADIPTVTNFEIPETSASLTVPITTFTAIDGIAVTGFYVSESDLTPNMDDSSWISSAPVAYVFASSGSKTLYAWVKDALGNVSSNPRSDSVDIVLDDVTAPVLSNGLPVGTLGSDTNSVTLSLVTDESAVCRFSNESGLAYGDMLSTFQNTGSTSHSSAINVTTGNNYTYYVRCLDGSLNANQTDFVVSFAVAAVVVTPPIETPVVTPESTLTVQAQEKKKKSSSKSKKKKSSGMYKVFNSKSSVTRGAVLIQRGSKFSKNSLVNLYFSKPGGGYYAPSRVKTSAAGAFSISYKANKPPGYYSWYAVDLATGKKSKTASYRVK